MATIKKIAKEKDYGSAVLSSDVKNYANDPYFVKKAEEAREAVSKLVLPGRKKK